MRSQELSVFLVLQLVVYASAPVVGSHPVGWWGQFCLLLLGFVERVGDDLSLHTVEVPGNVGPCGHPDNSFDGEVVVTSWTGPPSFDVVAISENVLWICAFPFAVSRCAFAFAVSP